MKLFLVFNHNSTKLRLIKIKERERIVKKEFRTRRWRKNTTKESNVKTKDAGDLRNVKYKVFLRVLNELCDLVNKYCEDCGLSVRFRNKKEKRKGFNEKRWEEIKEGSLEDFIEPINPSKDNINDENTNEWKKNLRLKKLLRTNTKEMIHQLNKKNNTLGHKYENLFKYSKTSLNIIQDLIIKEKQTIRRPGVTDKILYNLSRLIQEDTLGILV